MRTRNGGLVYLNARRGWVTDFDGWDADILSEGGAHRLVARDEGRQVQRLEDATCVYRFFQNRVTRLSLMPFRQQAVGEELREGGYYNKHRGNELFHISKYWKGTFGKWQKTAQSQRCIFIHAAWRLKGISQYNRSVVMIRPSYIIIIIKTYIIIG